MIKVNRLSPVLLHPSIGSWRREEYWTALFALHSASLSASQSPSLISYHCFFPGRWHPVPATRCTVVASRLEPSSIRSKRGRSCKRQHHVLVPRDWALRYTKVLAKPQPINTPLKELCVCWGEQRLWFLTQVEFLQLDWAIVIPLWTPVIGCSSVWVAAMSQEQVL